MKELMISIEMCQDTLLNHHRFITNEHDSFDNRTEVERIRINSEYSYLLN